MSEPQHEREHLLDELLQICRQYRQEVPKGGRKAWPQSIRTRVFRLRELGVGFHQVSAVTGIPVMTMYCWRPDGTTRKSKKRKKGSFLPVKVVASQSVRPSLVTVKTQPPAATVDRAQVTTVTVVLPNGIRLEGLDAAAALEIARRLS